MLASPSWSASQSRILLAMLAACALGALLPVYVDFMGDGTLRLLALPAAMVLALLLVSSPQLLFVLILLVRASGDQLLDETKISIGTYPIGLGGVINACVLLITFLLVVGNSRRIPFRWILVTWAPFLAIALYGVVIAPMKVDAAKLYMSQISFFAIFVAAFYFVRSLRDFHSCVAIVLWSSVIPAIYALVSIVAAVADGGLIGFRLASTFNHPNQFAFYLLFVLLLAVYALKSDSYALSSGKRIALTVYMLYLIGLLVLTQTRSAWLACFIAFAAYALLFQRRYLLYLVAIPLLALLFAPVRDRLFDLGTGNEYVQYAQLNSFAWRRMIWEAGLRWMQPDHYLIGYGLGAFQHYSPTFFPFGGRAVNFGAHSTFVQWSFELGAAGVAAYLWLFARMARVLAPIRHIDRMSAFLVFSYIIVYLVVSLSDNMPGYLAASWYFWFIVGGASSLAWLKLCATGQARKPGVAGTA